MTAHDEIRHHVRLYLMVFGALLVLTVVTVAVAELHLVIGAAVAVALLIATIKGSLVALFFMHLKWDWKHRAVHGVLLLTAVFFLFLLALPTLTDRAQIGEVIHRPPPAAAAPSH